MVDGHVAHLFSSLFGCLTGYLTSSWIKRNFSSITDLPPGEYKGPPQWNEGKLHWNSGPPYLATVQGTDGLLIATE